MLLAVNIILPQSQYSIWDWSNDKIVIPYSALRLFYTRKVKLGSPKCSDLRFHNPEMAINIDNYKIKENVTSFELTIKMKVNTCSFSQETKEPFILCLGVYRSGTT
jgi:hypothetical protein